MGSVTETIEETIDYLMEKAKKVGSLRYIYIDLSHQNTSDGALPKTVKKVAVLDRTKEKKVLLLNHLHLDVKNIF